MREGGKVEIMRRSCIGLVRLEGSFVKMRSQAIAYNDRLGFSQHFSISNDKSTCMSAR